MISPVGRRDLCWEVKEARRKSPEMHKVKVNLSLVQPYIFLRAVVSENKFNHCFIACELEQERVAVNRR